MDKAVARQYVADFDLSRVQDNLAIPLQQVLDLFNADPFVFPTQKATYDINGRVLTPAITGNVRVPGLLTSANIKSGNANLSNGALISGRTTLLSSTTDATALVLVPQVAGNLAYATNIGNTAPIWTLDNLGNFNTLGKVSAVGFVSNATGFRRSFQMGTFWSNGTMPTADKQFQRAITSLSTMGIVTAQIMNAAETMALAGSVVSLTGFANGSPGGTWTITVYLNGVATTLTGNSTTTKIVANANKGVISFAAGDVLAVFIKGSSASMNQSFSASIEVESAA